MKTKLITYMLAALLTTCELRVLVKRANHLAHLKHPTAAQRSEEAEINSRFENDMRARDAYTELLRENGR